MSRELIVNVDDIGIHEGAGEAAILTITHGVAASGSVMVVCPGAAATLEMLQGRRDVPVGVHLTLTADFPDVPWAPLTAGPSIQENGRLLGFDEQERLLARADAGDVEAEFRAQIEVLLAAGVQPTHLDWHSLMDGGRADIFDLTLALAEEYRVGLRAWTHHGRAALRGCGYTAQDQPFLDTFAISLEGKQGALIDRIRQLPDGLSEWAVHPAQRSAVDGGADVRRTDYDLLMADDTRHVLAEEGIVVLSYGDAKLRAPPLGSRSLRGDPGWSVDHQGSGSGKVCVREPGRPVGVHWRHVPERIGVL